MLSSVAQCIGVIKHFDFTSPHGARSRERIGLDDDAVVGLSRHFCRVHYCTLKLCCRWQMSRINTCCERCDLNRVMSRSARVRPLLNRALDQIALDNSHLSHLRCRGTFVQRAGLHQATSTWKIHIQILPLSAMAVSLTAEQARAPLPFGLTIFAHALFSTMPLSISHTFHEPFTYFVG